MQDEALVSVVIPTHNRASTVTSAIDSVLAQTYRRLEVIVVDDGSDDGTSRRLESYRNRITVVRQRRAGPSAARNRGAALASGSILAFLDSDDFWMRGKIARQVGLLQRAGPSVCCCVCNAVVFDEEGRRVGESFQFAGIRPPFMQGLWSNPQEVLATRFLLFNQVVAIRREAFERCRGFNENLDLLEDHDMALRLARQGSWALIRDPLVVKRNGSDGIGVRCMNDRARHNQAALDALSPWIDPASGLSRAARKQLMLSSCELRIERLAHRLSARSAQGDHPVGRSLHQLVSWWKSIRRRLPGWPRLEGHAL